MRDVNQLLSPGAAHPLRPTGSRWSREASGGGPSVPAVVGTGGVDQSADDGDGGGEEEEELDHGFGLVGAATQFAVAVHPGVGALDDPAFADLDRGRLALGRNLMLIAQDVQQVAGLARVVPGVKVHARTVGQWSDRVGDTGQGGLEKRGVVGVGGGGK